MTNRKTVVAGLQVLGGCVQLELCHTVRVPPARAVGAVPSGLRS
jgi:hypothetical protein